MVLTLGPVIGDVSFGQARILAEFDTEGLQILQLKGKEGFVTVQETVLANRPQIFKFEGLSPGQEYQVLYEDKQVGSLRTQINDKSPDLKFVVISCNSIQSGLKLNEDKNLWKDLQKRITEKKNIDFLMHIGDQVYLDQDYWEKKEESGCAYAKIEQIMKDLTPDQFDSKLEEAREILRYEYRKTWGFEATRFCLANCPNKMMLDDHEVLDDAGKDLELQDPNHWKGWYSQKVTRYVYYEYQKRLIKDIDLEKLDSETEEFNQFVQKDSGFFVIDNRGHFLWHGDKFLKEESYLGKKQKRTLLDGLSDKGLFKDVKSLFIVSTIPMVFVSQNMTKAGNITLTNDFNQFWVYDNEPELAFILETLRLWQKAKSNRVVTLIGGDIHMGGHYDLYHKEKPFAKQLITSAMTSPSLSKMQALGYEAVQAFSRQELKGDFSFDHHDMAFCNNYGYIEVKDDNQGRIVETALVTNKEGMKMENIQDNRRYKGNKAGEACCSIF